MAYEYNNDYDQADDWDEETRDNRTLATTASLPIMMSPTRSASQRQAHMLKDKRRQLHSLKRNQTLANEHLQEVPEDQSQEGHNIKVFKQRNSPEVSNTKHIGGLNQTKTTTYMSRSPTSPPALPYRAPKTTVIQAKRKFDDDGSYDDDGYDLDDDWFLDCHQIEQLLENGPLRFRFFVFLGSLFMLASSYLDYQAEAYYTAYGYGSMSPLFFLITIYVWVFATFIATMEILPFQMKISRFHRQILKYMNFMRYTWGRGFLYLFSGSLQLSLFTTYNMYSGGYMMLMGLISIMIGRIASRKLKVLVKKIGNNTNLMDDFSRCDQDRDGYLNIHEFRRFVKERMGTKKGKWRRRNNVTLTEDECIHAFQAIDKNHDRRLTFKELSGWYATAKYETRRGGDGVLV